MNNEEEFRRLFTEFEKETKKKISNKKLDLSTCIEILKKNRVSPYYNEYDFISFCRWCRNRISHVNDNEKYLIYTDELINRLKEVIDVVKHPYTIYEKAIKEVSSANINDNVKNIMRVIQEKRFTHIPIYDNNKSLVGIFSEGSLFNYLLKETNITIDENTTFNDIKDCININNSKELIMFVSKDKLYDEITNKFIVEYQKGERLSCVMITEQGSNKEEVKGILTSWDIIGN